MQRLQLQKFFCAVGALAALGLGTAHADTPLQKASVFPFHDGDRVVFLGDSITEQKLYTTYLETYLLTRFPTWSLSFRNAGWGGDTSYLRQRGLPPPQALQRDVIALKPTVVTIDFSMNDASYGSFQQDKYDLHIAGQNQIVQQLKAAGIRPIMLTSSAVEKNEQGDDLVGYNQTLEQFAAGDAAVAAKAGIPFADQFHPFVDAINRLRSINPSLRLSGDAVHPGNAGHLMMADSILTGLNAPALVSSATLSARHGSVVSTVGAYITNVVAMKNGGLSFQRRDRALVFPIEPAARPILQLVPVADDLDRYMLQIIDLAPGEYTVSVNGVTISRFSAAQLADGVNLSYYDSPLSAPGMEILKHVYNKNNLYFNRWRNVQLANPAPADQQVQLTSLDRQIADEERQINSFRHPAVFQFLVAPFAEPAAMPSPAAAVPAAQPVAAH